MSVDDTMLSIAAMRRWALSRSALHQRAASLHRCSGRLDRDPQPSRCLAHALVEAQQSETGDRGTRDEKRCEVDGIKSPNRVTGERLTRTINNVARDSQNVPMGRSGVEVRATVGRFGFRQFLERHHPQQHAITFDLGQVGRGDDFGLPEQVAPPARSARQGATPAPRSTRHRDSPSAALVVKQLRRASPTLAWLSPQRGIHVYSSPRAQGQEAPLG